MSEDIIYDEDRVEFDDKTSVDFRLDVPKTPEDDLRSSYTVKDGTVTGFELRLGLMSRSEYDAEEIEMLVFSILDGFNLPEHDPKFLPPDSDRVPTDEFRVKVSYDPHWGKVGFWQVHLRERSLLPLDFGESEFREFVQEFTTEYIEKMEWDSE